MTHAHPVCGLPSGLKAVRWGTEQVEFAEGAYVRSSDSDMHSVSVG